jgi:hypothetical protein
MKPTFRDPGLGRGRFTDRIWVACPKCGSAALATSTGLGAAQVSCVSCGYLSIDPRSIRLAAGLGVQGRFPNRPIQCENCGRPHPVIARPARRNGPKLTGTIRCAGCGHVGNYVLQPLHRAGADGFDPWFGLPLFLSERIGSETLWVYNCAHLALLEDYLGAAIRKRPALPVKMTMLARLPRWMKIKSGRDRALRGIVRLRRRALKAGIN